MSEPLTLSSREVRWFLPGPARDHPQLMTWFETCAPLPGRRPGPLAWRDQPDTYLLLPGGTGLGIKWREGRFEVKGRVAAAGESAFEGGHCGRVESWFKWSQGGLPPAYRELFERGAGLGLATAGVRKSRAQRQVRLDRAGAGAEEVPMADGPPARGMGLELADLEVGGRRYCSVAFEACPDDPVMAAAFPRLVGLFLGGLSAPVLPAAVSCSYPAWLDRVSPTR